MSVFRRHHRPTWYFQARTQSEWKQLSTKTSSKKLAREIERAWSILADRHRAWDVLEQVLSGSLAIGSLYDAFVASHGDVTMIRDRLADIDVAALVPEFLKWYAKTGVKPDTVAHADAALRWLLPEGKMVPASRINTEWLTARLTDYPASPSTRRKIHSLWSVFFNYTTTVKRAFRQNPMRFVQRPGTIRPSVQFYEREDAKRIVNAQPSPERAAYFAVCYGAGLEASVALKIRRSDCNPANRSIRAPGTKAASRDRVVIVDKWAWDEFWQVAKFATPMAQVFNESWSRFTVSDWHRATVKELKLELKYPLKNVRHHWAATHLRAGWSIYAVQHQLGHSSPQLTLAVYGLFIPSGADYTEYDRRLEEYESRRISANGSADDENRALKSATGGDVK